MAQCEMSLHDANVSTIEILRKIDHYFLNPTVFGVESIALFIADSQSP